MAEKRMLIVPAELVEKINANRGDLAQAEFLAFLIDSHLQERHSTADPQESSYATKEELQEVERGLKELLRSFLDFSVSYSMELGRETGAEASNVLSTKLGDMDVFSGRPPRKESKG